MLPIKPVCEAKNMRRDGTSLIFIQYCYSAEKRTTVSTEIGIPPAFWNKKRLGISNDLPPLYGDVTHLNSEVKRMIRLAEDIVEIGVKKGVTNRGFFLKQVFAPNFDIATLERDEQKIKVLIEAATNKTNLDLFYQLDDYIKSKEKKVTGGTLGVYRQMKEHLLAFQQYTGKPIAFESFDYNFYDSFVNFLTYEFIQKRRKQIIKGLKINTIGKSIKHFRGFIKDRVKRKIIAPIDLSDFKGMEEEADAIYLTEHEIETIRLLNLSKHQHLEKYRDLLVLGCLTGLRFSDFTQLRPEDLRGRKLFKKQEKSEHWVVIPLKDAAYQILTIKFDKIVPVVLIKLKTATLQLYFTEIDVDQWIN
jgi:integrase